jgi:hypothetical protein
MTLMKGNEIIDIDICQAVSVMGIVLHDMPQNRFAADLDHGFGFEFRFLTETGTETAAENNNRNIMMHVFSP